MHCRSFSCALGASIVSRTMTELVTLDALGFLLEVCDVFTMLLILLSEYFLLAVRDEEDVGGRNDEEDWRGAVAGRFAERPLPENGFHDLCLCHMLDASCQRSCCDLFG